MNSFRKKEVRVRPPQASWNTTAATTPRQKAGRKRTEQPLVESDIRSCSSPPELLLPPARGAVVFGGVGMLRPHHPYMCHYLLGCSTRVDHRRMVSSRKRHPRSNISPSRAVNAALTARLGPSNNLHRRARTELRGLAHPQHHLQTRRPELELTAAKSRVEDRRGERQPPSPWRQIKVA